MNFYGNLHSTKLRNTIRKRRAHFKVSKISKIFSFVMTINGEGKYKNSLSTTQNALPFFYCGNLTLFGWFDTKWVVCSWAITWYKNRHAGEQMTHWDMLNQKKLKFGGFVYHVPVRHLLSSMAICTTWLFSRKRPIFMLKWKAHK